jgi:tetratricopeptide (TPR) repeat protein
MKLGRISSAIADLEVALKYSRQAGSMLDYKILTNLASIEVSGGGNWRHAITHHREAIAAVPTNERGWLFPNYFNLAYTHARLGDLAPAEHAVTALHTLLGESRQWSHPSISRHLRARWEAYTAIAGGKSARRQGRLRESGNIISQGDRSLHR